MAKKASVEPDGVFFLKVVLYLILGTLWITFTVSDFTYPIPVGLMLGIYFARHDHFKIDKKIEFVTLIFAAVLSFLFPVGFVLAIS